MKSDKHVDEVGEKVVAIMVEFKINESEGWHK